MIKNDTEDLTDDRGRESKFVKLISRWLASDERTQAVVLAEAQRLSALLASVRAGEIEPCPACPMRRPSDRKALGEAGLPMDSLTACRQAGSRGLSQELQA